MTAASRKTQNPQTGALQPQGDQRIALNNAERFTAKVMQEFGSSIGAIQVTDYQRQLIQGYFIAIDRALNTAEEDRLRKNDNNRDHKYDNPLSITWDNVNLTNLALDVVHYARMGLDMMQKNHLFAIPFKNSKAQKYDVNLMPGYNGIQYIAEKYALEKPAAVTVELVYSTDIFRPIKKGVNVTVESYEFTIKNPFERGEVVGGFGYIEYPDPRRNRLIIMTRRDIEKRKPKYASANFWGGRQKVWENGKQVEQETDGWYEEMCLKTIKREVYSPKNIPVDPAKIDDSYQYMKLREARIAELEAQDVIDVYANGSVIDTAPPVNHAAPAALPEPSPGFTVDTSTGEVREPLPVGTDPVSAESAAAATADGQTAFGGPTF